MTRRTGYTTDNVNGGTWIAGTESYGDEHRRDELGNARHRSTAYRLALESNRAQWANVSWVDAFWEMQAEWFAWDRIEHYLTDISNRACLNEAPYRTLDDVFAAAIARERVYRQQPAWTRPDAEYLALAQKEVEEMLIETVDTAPDSV